MQINPHLGVAVLAQQVLNPGKYDIQAITSPVSVGGLGLESQRTTIHSSTPLMSTTLKVMRLSSASKTRELATGKTLVRNV